MYLPLFHHNSHIAKLQHIQTKHVVAILYRIFEPKESLAKMKIQHYYSCTIRIPQERPHKSFQSIYHLYANRKHIIMSFLYMLK